MNIVVIFFHSYLLPDLIHDTLSSLIPDPRAEKEELTGGRGGVSRSTLFSQKALREPGPRDSPPSTKTTKEVFNCIPPSSTGLILVPDKEGELIEP